MSLRPVELQFVLHKNDEVGIKQNQLNHKPTHDQAMLAEDAARQADKQRQTIMKSEKPQQASITDSEKESSEERKENKQSPDKRNTMQSKPDMEKIEHPFKGRHIDFTL